MVRIQIHETGGPAGSERYWRHVLGVPAFAVRSRHDQAAPAADAEENVGADYHGCLSVYVRRGEPLLQQVEGWVVGASGAGGALPRTRALVRVRPDPS